MRRGDQLRVPKLILLDVVGLTPSLIGEKTPNLARIAGRGSLAALECPFPALTLSSQASLLCGAPPSQHGIVGNGWYWKELAEVLFWRQPHALLQSEDLPTRLRRQHKKLQVAKLFWWFNMYSGVDFALTPRPMYPADGRKIPDVHSDPPALRIQLQEELGSFPLFHFWGPAADLSSSQWISEASLRVIRRNDPDLSMVYLPHLDYDFQRFGPDAPASQRALAEVDALVGQFLELAEESGRELIIVSEYGIDPVSRVVHPNRALREAGLLSVRDELGLERLDCGASRAFAVADHQIAHIYLNDPAARPRAIAALSALEGVEKILEGDALAAEGLDHPRCGDLLLVADPDAWFSYYFWLDDALAPDYARCVDIHRKPGYDPAELFLDPKLRFPKLKIIRRLIAKKLGQRCLMDVIGLDPTLVRGSHGRRAASAEGGPLILSSLPHSELRSGETFPLQGFPDFLEALLLGD